MSYCIGWSIPWLRGLTTPVVMLGNGMAKGFLMLSIIAVFFFIAVGIAITNYFVLKGVTSPGIRFLAVVPLLVSVAHVVYTLFFT